MENIVHIERFVDKEDESKVLYVKINGDGIAELIRTAITLTILTLGRNFTEKEIEVGGTLASAIHYLLCDSSEEELNKLNKLSEEIDEESEDEFKS